jgi:hypothetical protein
MTAIQSRCLLTAVEKARRMTEAAAVIHVGSERKEGKVLPVHVVF